MNSLEALRDYGFDTKQPRSLRRPIARTTRTVFLTGNNHERHALGLIMHCRIVDTRSLAIRMMNRHAAFNTRHHQILDTHVSKRATSLHVAIATSCAVTVEVFDVDATF